MKAKANAGKKAPSRPTSFFIDFENVRGAGLAGVENLGPKDRVVVLYGSKDSSLRIGQVENVMRSKARVEFVKVATGKPNALDFQLVAMLFMKIKKKRDYVIVSKDTGFDFAIKVARERGSANVRRQQTISGEPLEQKKLPQPKQAKQLPQPKKQQQLQGSKRGKQPQQAQQQAPAKDQPEGGAQVTPQDSPATQQQQQQQSQVQQQPARPPKDPFRVSVEKVLGKHLGGLPPAKKVEIVVAALQKCETKAQFYNYLRGNMGNEKGLEFYRDVKGCFEQLHALPK